MTNRKTLQKIKNEKLFFKYCDGIVFLKNIEYIEPLELMLQEENINPCRVQSAHDLSLLNMTIMGKHKILFDILIKYANDDETPPELESSWSGIAYKHNLYYFKKMVKKGHFEGINKKNPDGTYPLSKFIFKIAKKSFKVNYENFFEDEMIKFFLDKGADINTVCNNLRHPKKFIFYFLEDKFIIKDSEYEKCLNKALEYGLDINKPYDLNMNNNFIQYVFQTNHLYDTKNSHSVNNIDFYLKLMKDHNYKFEYKNKMDETAIDILKEQGNQNHIIKVNALYEKEFLEKRINESPMGNEFVIKKKRI